jgi:hypothetical protein
MSTTRRGFLATAGVAAAQDFAHAQEHGHSHEHQVAASDPALREERHSPIVAGVFGNTVSLFWRVGLIAAEWSLITLVAVLIAPNAILRSPPSAARFRMASAIAKRRFARSSALRTSDNKLSARAISCAA